MFYPTLHQHLATDYRRNLAVTAGAGTGKTEVMTRRIIKILHREKYSLDRLLVLTFTDKAAVEMKERIYGAVEKELEKTGNPDFQKLKDNFFNNYISTFHAFCAALLREYPIEADIDPYFRVLDETEKVFFLRSSINRLLKERASQKENRDIHILSEEMTRGALAAAIFDIIQKREDLGPWLEGFNGLEFSGYLSRLEQYRDCLLREMAFKLYRGKSLDSCLQQLKELAALVPYDSTALSRKRDALLEIIPLFLAELEPAARGSVDAGRLVELKEEIIENTRLTKPSKAWYEEAYLQLKGVFLTLRYLLKSFNIEEFAINVDHEECGFEMLKALARLTHECLDTYQEDKAAENYLDFQDLQLKVLELLSSRKHRHVLDELKERFLFIMVDEFQDTNDLQWNIIRQLAADATDTVVNPKLFIVGDEKQAIYAFRGGDVSLFSRVRRELQRANKDGGHHLKPFDLKLSDEKDYNSEFRERIGDQGMVREGEIVFGDNFRSAAGPINFFNMFFQDLLFKEIYEDYDARPQKLICAGNKREGSVELLLVDGEKTGAGTDSSGGNPPGEPTADINQHFKEALLIVERIKEVFMGDEEKYAYVRECVEKGKPAVAILLNRRTMLKTYEEALRINRIDFTVVRGRGFFQRQEIVDLGNLLQLLTNPSDDLSLVAFLRSPAGHLSDEAIFLLSRMPGGPSLYAKLPAALQDGAAEKRFSPRDFRAVQNAARNLERWQSMAGRLPLVEFLRLILHEGGYYASLSRGFRGEQALSNVEKLLESARVQSLEEGADLADFNEWLGNRIDFIEEEGEADIDISLGGAVQIMTVHQSKGLEFPMVFVPDMGAFFNLGAREAMHTGQLPFTLKITAGGFDRQEAAEVGVNAPNPDNEWESEPILSKRIIKRRLRDKLIAEKKRLFYVAATRAMDHLVLVGHIGSSSMTAPDRLTYSPMDELSSWMDWLNRILGLFVHAKDSSGEILYENEAGEPMVIPYRKFSRDKGLLGGETEYRTEF